MPVGDRPASPWRGSGEKARTGGDGEKRRAETSAVEDAKARHRRRKIRDRCDGRQSQREDEQRWNGRRAMRSEELERGGLWRNTWGKRRDGHF